MGCREFRRRSVGRGNLVRWGFVIAMPVVMLVRGVRNQTQLNGPVVTDLIRASVKKSCDITVSKAMVP